MKKYALPGFPAGVIDQAVYQRWLAHKAKARVRRDRKRGNLAAIGEAYPVAIHQAVSTSNGKDAYTGEPLDWSLVSCYDNTKSAEGKRRCKHGFARLPTVDHVGASRGPCPTLRYLRVSLSESCASV